MSEGFNRFKKKIFLELIIKSILIGVSFGLLAFAITFIPCKVTGIKLNPFIYILIGLGTSLLVGGLVFLVLNPNKVKLAKRIDKQLNLNEKVQTMVEFENENNVMLQIQREDTNDRLKNISIKSFKMKFHFLFIIIPIIAIAACITSIAIPAKAEDIPNTDDKDDDPIFNLDKWTTLKIKEIIKTVKESELESYVKEGYVDLLEDLIIELEADETVSQMKESVDQSISKLQLQLDIINTNNEYYTVLSNGSDPSINAIVTNIMTLNVKNINNGFVNYKLQLIDNIGVILEGQDVFVGLASSIQDNIGVKLKKSNLDKEEAIYKALLNISNNVNSAVGSATASEEIAKTFDENLPIIIAEFEKQALNKKYAEYIETSLLELFELEEEKPDDSNDDNPDEDENPDEDDEKLPNQSGNGGGLGTGDIIFGSDDAFFDPIEGIVEYGKVMDQYRAEIHQKYLDGLISQEYFEICEKYFDVLYGIQEDINNNEGE